MRWILTATLPVERLEPLNQLQQAAQCSLAAGIRAGIRGLRLQVIQADEPVRPGAFALDHVGCSRVVGDAVNPGPQRAAPVETGEAAPQSDVDFLAQLGTLVGVRLVGAGESSDGRAVFGGRLLIQPVLLRSIQIRPALRTVVSGATFLQIA